MNQPGTMLSGLAVSMRLVDNAFRLGLRRAQNVLHAGRIFRLHRYGQIKIYLRVLQIDWID